MEKNAYIAAVDGGGTKTDYVLCTLDGHIVKYVARGSSNPFDLGIDACRAELREGIGELLSGDFEAPLAGLFAGLSGGGSGDAQSHLVPFLRDLLPRAKTDIYGDTINAISSGVLSGEGCALIGGTGSSASARFRGTYYRSGGRGYLFDGAGGGYDLGVDVIRNALQSEDGLAPRSRMADLLEQQLGETAGAHLRTFYVKGKTYIASFAPIAQQAAEEGDAVASAVLDRNAAYMALLLNSLFTRVDADFPGAAAHPEVSLVGGLFRKRHLWEDRIRSRLNREAVLHFVTAPAVFGAAAEALRLAGHSADEAFRDTFTADWNALKR